MLSSGVFGSWEGRYARQRASGGASGAWIGRARQRKGLSPFGESHLALQYQYIRRQMERVPRKNFPRPKIQISDRRAHFFPQKVAESLMQRRFPAANTSLQHGYQDMSEVIVGLESIGEVFGRTRWTIRRWIEREGFPATCCRRLRRNRRP